jgi:hypothetical protein
MNENNTEPSATAPVPENLGDMAPDMLNQALHEITNTARKELGSCPSRTWVAEHIEVEGVGCRLEVLVSAKCKSLDTPRMPSGWRFELEWSCMARLEAQDHGAVFSGEVSQNMVRSDPHAEMACSRGAEIINTAMDRALYRLRHHQAFAAWREAAAIGAEIEVGDGSGAGAKRL